MWNFFAYSLLAWFTNLKRKKQKIACEQVWWKLKVMYEFKC